MLAFLLFLIILLISFGTGARILRLLLRPLQPEKAGRPARPALSPSEEFVFGAALGLGIISYAIFGIGLARGLYWWAFVALLVMLAVIGWPEIKRWYVDMRVSGRGVMRRTFSISGILMGVWLVLVGLLCLLGALAPVAGADWDGMAYHLAVPKIYLQHHHMLFLPWMSHSNFPSATEMLYLLGLALRGQALAKLFHFGFAALTAIAVYCWAKSTYGKTMGLLAAVVFASVPLILWESTVPYNDLSFALYCLLAVWALWRTREGNAKGWIILSGLLAGLALGTKALAGFLVVFAILAILWPRRSEEPTENTHPSRATALALWLLPVILVAAPWYIRSYVWTGNPVYPFFYNIFGGQYWSPTLAADYATAQAKFGMGHGVPWLFALPWTLTMYGRWFLDHPEQQLPYNMLMAVIGPLFLGFLPIMVLQARKDGLMRYLLAFCGVAVIAWFFLSAQTTRYLLPVLPILSIGIAGAIVYASAQWRILTRVINVIIGIELVWALIICARFIGGPQTMVATGGESRNQYISHTLNIYPIIRDVNSTLSRDARVMLIGDTRGFYLDRDYLWGPWNNNLITPEQASSPETLTAAFRRLGVTHVLLAPSVQKVVLADQPPAEGLDRSLRDLTDRGDLRPALSNRGFVVLAVERH